MNLSCITVRRQEDSKHWQAPARNLESGQAFGGNVDTALKANDKAV